MLFSNLRMSKKLLMAFLGVVAVSIASSSAVGWGFLSIRSANEANIHTFKIVSLVSSMAKSFGAKQVGMRGYLITNNDASLNSYYVAIKEYDAAIAEARQLITDPDTRSMLEQMATGQQQWQTEIADGELRLMRAGQIDDARKLDQSEAAEVRKTVRAVLAKMEARERDLLQKRTDEVAAALDQGLTILGIGGLIAVLAAAAAGTLLSRSVARPIATMTGVMGKLAAGDHAVEVPARDRRDEIGAMAHAVQTFKDAGLAKLRLEVEAAETRRLSEVERSRVDAERHRISEEQAVVVDGLAHGLGLLAEGNLVHRLDRTFAAEYEQLRTDYNAAMAKLQDAMRIVATNTGTIRAGSTEISMAANDLAKRTEQQAASLEETAAALDEITATVKKTADGARHARDVVSATKGNAEHSSDVVGRAVAAMTAIETSSQQVSQIIGVIDEIAFQTNLLALNAGVEAARAGEAGRGFAVVASEVRALAQRSAEAAKEIKALISTSANQVNEGVGLVGETGEALRLIATQVAEVHAVVTDIAASAQEQATGLEQVNMAVNQMDQVTQQNAAMVEESTAASQSLAGDTEVLSQLMDRFTLEQGRPRADMLAKDNQKPRRVAPPSMGHAAKARGRGALAAASAPAPESWEEF